MAEMVDRETGEFIPGMPPKVSAAIIAVCKEVKQLGADDKNEHGKYNFVSVDKFYERIGKLMAAAGLALLVDETASEVKEGKSGNPWLFMSYNLTFMHEGGDVSSPMRRSCAMPINGPQAFGAAQSYIEKQFLRQVFKVPTGERDADETTPSDDGAPQSQQRTQRPPAASAAPSSAAKDEARKRWRELRDVIDTATSPTEIDEILTCPAWEAMVKHVKTADAENAERVIAQLTERANQKKALMLSDGPTGDGDGY